MIPSRDILSFQSFWNKQMEISRRLQYTWIWNLRQRFRSHWLASSRILLQELPHLFCSVVCLVGLGCLFVCWFSTGVFPSASKHVIPPSEKILLISTVSTSYCPISLFHFAMSVPLLQIPLKLIPHSVIPSQVHQTILHIAKYNGQILMSSYLISRKYWQSGHALFFNTFNFTWPPEY